MQERVPGEVGVKKAKCDAFQDVQQPLSKDTGAVEDKTHFLIIDVLTTFIC